MGCLLGVSKEGRKGKDGWDGEDEEGGREGGLVLHSLLEKLHILATRMYFTAVRDTLLRHAAKSGRF